MTDLTPPSVSVVMPVYNCADYVDKAIKSVLAQTHADLELLIIDDCSTDGTFDTIRKTFSDPRIRLIELAVNSGPAVARNKGIAAARGRYVAFLDSDDIWLEKKLEKQLAFMKSREACVTYTSYRKIDGNDDVISDLVKAPERTTYKSLLRTNSIGCSTAMYDTRVFGTVAMPDIRKRQDHGFWLKLLQDGRTAYGIDEDLVRYRVRKDSVSGNKLAAAKYQWQLYRKVVRLGFIQCLYYFTHYSINGVFKHLK